MTQQYTTGAVVISAIVGAAVACAAHGWYAIASGLLAWLVMFAFLVAVLNAGDK